MLVQGSRPLPPERVEQLAREQGMVFPQEVVPYSDDANIRENSDDEKGGNEQ